jgi:hypothetical protein
MYTSAGSKPTSRYLVYQEKSKELLEWSDFKLSQHPSLNFQDKYNAIFDSSANSNNLNLPF